MPHLTQLDFFAPILVVLVKHMHLHCRTFDNNVYEYIFCEEELLGLSARGWHGKELRTLKVSLCLIPPQLQSTDLLPCCRQCSRVRFPKLCRTSTRYSATQPSKLRPNGSRLHQADRGGSKIRTNRLIALVDCL
jgi:hypothetical protein